MTMTSWARACGVAGSVFAGWSAKHGKIPETTPAPLLGAGLPLHRRNRRHCGGLLTILMPESESAKLAAIAWIREQMDNYALTLDDLMAAGCFDGEPSPEEAAAAAIPDVTDKSKPAEATAIPQPKKAALLYRNAMGQSWDGTGEYPDWLQRAVNAGQSIDFYRVD